MSGAVITQEIKYISIIILVIRHELAGSWQLGDTGRRKEKLGRIYPADEPLSWTLYPHYSCWFSSKKSELFQSCYSFNKEQNLIKSLQRPGSLTY